MSKKIFQDLLEAFKRSNKERKAKIALKAGYITPEEYKEYLESMITGESEPKVEKKESQEEITDLVIAFDTTGSMRSYIGAVKNHVKELIPKLFNQNKSLRISIVAFGDYCDMVGPNHFGKAYQVIGLTDNELSLMEFVRTAEDTSGGDGDEFYELVIKKIVEETQWRKGSTKSVLFIADENPHIVGYSCGLMVQKAQIDWRVEAKKAASLGIKFDTLRIKPQVRWYRELSDITDGICLDFNNSQKTSELVEATFLARGGMHTNAAFHAKMSSAEVIADSELSAVYSMYKEVIE